MQTVIHKRDLILGVRDRWNEQYKTYDPMQVIGPRDHAEPVSVIRKRLSKLDLETCSEADVDKAIGVTEWAANKCDECGGNFETTIQVGNMPDYEARWVTLCAKCLSDAMKLLKSTEPKL